MAFWGVEVKPGEPITHSCEKARGRLRISRATLGFGKASKTFGDSNRIIVQCNVGDRSPVLLCVLLCDEKESCQLGLEFEEADDVVFSVIGPRSVFLCGYYVYRNHRSNSHSDTESYGIDIENTRTDGSSYHSDDDMYEDSFINDDEKKASQQSPVLSSKGMDEATVEKEKPKEKKGRGKQLKRYQVIESDDDANSHENEDGFISVLKSKRAVRTTVSDDGEKIAQATEEMDDVAKDDGLWGSESKQKDDPLNIKCKVEGYLYREKKTSLEEKTQVNEEKNELREEDERLEKLIDAIQDAVHGKNAQDTNTTQDLPVSNGKDQLQSLDIAKPKKKRKGRSLKAEKARKFQNDNEDCSVLREVKEHEVEASPNMGLDENYLWTHPESGSVNGQKSKKRRKELPLEGSLTEGIDEKYHYAPKEDISEQGSRHADCVIKDLRTARESKAAKWGALQLLSNLCGEYEDQQGLIETSTEGIGANCHSMPRDDEGMRGPVAEITAEDAPAANGEEQEQQTDNHIITESESVKQVDKIKKKRKKTKGEIGLNVGVVEMTDNQGTTPMKYDNQSTKTMPLQKRTLSNGLIIEELASGPPNGKVAAPNKRAKILYTAMLKESGHVIIESAPYKFRLGDGETIDGLNVGVEGMHVGDKRRLVVPPSMGFGDCEDGDIPPNSWLIYDIELVNVYK